VQTPENILAGVPQQNPAAAVPGPAQPISPVETPLSGDSAGVIRRAPGELEDNPPLVPGSFADKLKTALATAHAVMSGLGAVGAVGKAPEGGGILYGMGKAGQQIAARDAAAQERADKQKQQDIENKRAEATQDLEKQKFSLYTVEANARMANEQRVLHQTDEKNIESSIADGSALVERMKNAPVPATVLRSSISTDELKRRQMAGEFQDGTETALPTGKIFTGGTDPKTGEPQWETSWSVLMLPQRYDLTKDDINIIKDLPQFRDKDGKTDVSKIPTQMSGAQFNSLYQDAADRSTAIAARNDALVKSDIASRDDANKLEWSHDLGNQWLNALGNNNMDIASTIQSLATNKQYMAAHPNFLKEVQDNYGGADKLNAAIDGQQKNAIEAQKAKAEEESKNAFLGDPSKIGNRAAYLASFNPQEQAALIAAGNNKLPILRWDYLISKQPNFVSALTALFPDFRGDRIQQYLTNMKDYTAAGAAGKALNSASTAARDLMSLYDNETYTGHFIPGSKQYVNIQQDIDKVSSEIAKANKGGNAAPSEDEINAVKKDLQPAIGSRREAVQEQLRNMLHKVDEYQNTWGDNIPSPTFHQPMPGWSADAKVASAYTLNNGKFVVRDPAGNAYYPKDYNTAVSLQRGFDAQENAEKRGQ